jgi:hypothetical protein
MLIFRHSLNPRAIQRHVAVCTVARFYTRDVSSSKLQSEQRKLRLCGSMELEVPGYYGSEKKERQPSRLIAVFVRHTKPFNENVS